MRQLEHRNFVPGTPGRPWPIMSDQHKKPTRAYTTSSGSPLERPPQSRHSAGGLLLSDFALLDMLSHFNRERIPERVVHAKGTGAYGEFEVGEPCQSPPAKAWEFTTTG